MSTARLLLCLIAAIALSGIPIQSYSGNAAEPFLEIEKPIFAENESVRFWVGVSSTQPIPKDLRHSCVLHIVRPNGDKMDDIVSWPSHGDASRGWKGGWGLSPLDRALGKYTVAFEFVGRKTAEQSFTIIKNPLGDSLLAQWILFETFSGSVRTHGALLRVVNRTGRIVRFAEAGSPDSEVFMSVKQYDPPSQKDFFVPLAAKRSSPILPNVVPEMITLPPGGSMERTLSLAAAYDFQEEKDYQVTLNTVLTVFVGTRADPDSELFPLRIPVFAKSHFRW